MNKTKIAKKYEPLSDNYFQLSINFSQGGSKNEQCIICKLPKKYKSIHLNKEVNGIMDDLVVSKNGIEQNSDIYIKFHELFDLIRSRLDKKV